MVGFLVDGQKRSKLGHQQNQNILVMAGLFGWVDQGGEKPLFCLRVYLVFLEYGLAVDTTLLEGHPHPLHLFCLHPLHPVTLTGCP